MKWCLSSEFNLKDCIPATSSSTLNATGKSATCSQGIGRSMKHKNISLKKKQRENPNLYHSIESNNTEGLFWKQNDKKIKTTTKTLLKISSPVIVMIDYILWAILKTAYHIKVNASYVNCNKKAYLLIQVKLKSFGTHIILYKPILKSHWPYQ